MNLLIFTSASSFWLFFFLLPLLSSFSSLPCKSSLVFCPLSSSTLYPVTSSHSLSISYLSSTFLTPPLLSMLFYHPSIFPCPLPLSLMPHLWTFPSFHILSVPFTFHSPIHHHVSVFLTDSLLHCRVSLRHRVTLALLVQHCPSSVSYIRVPGWLFLCEINLVNRDKGVSGEFIAASCIIKKEKNQGASVQQMKYHHQVISGMSEKGCL